MYFNVAVAEDVVCESSQNPQKPGPSVLPSRVLVCSQIQAISNKTMHNRPSQLPKPARKNVDDTTDEAESNKDNNTRKPKSKEKQRKEAQSDSNKDNNVKVQEDKVENGKDKKNKSKLKEVSKDAQSNSKKDNTANNGKVILKVVEDSVLDVDVSAFGFGGDFAADLVSGSPINISKSNQAGNGSEVSENQQNKKLRRDIYVMPAQISLKKNTNSDASKTDDVKKNKNKGTSKLDPKNVVLAKDKSNLNKRQTYAKETASVKSSKKYESPVKSKSTESEVNYEQIENPFKPSKTLFRSPPPGSKTADVNKTGYNSHEFLAKLKNNTVPAISSPLPEPVFQDEPTTYFNTDMEFTAVIDTASFLQRFAKTDRVSPNVPVITVEEPPVPENTDEKTKMQASSKPVPQSKAQDGKGKSENEKVKPSVDKHSSKLESKSEHPVEDAAAVEVRTKKPGVFTFSVSRKEADGSRKPVPENVSRARSKKKATPVDTIEEPRKTGSDRDMFNFGDRTPTMPLEKLAKTASGSVYDLSMTENSHAKPAGLSDLRSRFDASSKSKPVKVPDPRPEENIYYLPLKGSPDEKPTHKQTRSKSKSRSKSRGRVSESEDEDWVPKGRSKSRARSRGRSVSRKKTETDSASNARSLSRGRVSESDDENMTSHTRSKSRARSRGRSVSRKTDKTNNESNATSKNTRSKSRSRATDKEETDDSKEARVQPRRSARSKSRARAVCEDTEPVFDNDKEEVESNCFRRGRSRSRARVIESDSDQEMPTDKTQQETNVKLHKENNVLDNVGVETSEKIPEKECRSRPRRRKTYNINENSSEIIENSDSQASKIDNNNLETDNVVVTVPESDSDNNENVGTKRTRRKSCRTLKSDNSDCLNDNDLNTMSDLDAINKTEQRKSNTSRDNAKENVCSDELVSDSSNITNKRGKSSRKHKKGPNTDTDAMDFDKSEDENIDSAFDDIVRHTDRSKEAVDIKKKEELPKVTKSSKKSTKKRVEKKAETIENKETSKAKMCMVSTG